MSEFRAWSELSGTEKEQVNLMLVSLKEFSWGFVTTDKMSDEFPDGTAPMRFMMNSLYQYCASYFLVTGGNKLKNVLIGIGSGDLLEPIDRIISHELGETSFGEIIKVYRNKMLTHPNYLFSSLEEDVHKKFDILEPTNAKLFSGMVNDLYYQTQVLYKNLLERFPEAV